MDRNDTIEYHGDYNVVEEIGGGSSGDIFIVKISNGNKYALKRIGFCRTDGDIGIPLDISSEIGSLIHFKSITDIVNIVGISQKDDHILLFMELMNMNLSHFIDIKTIYERLGYINQLVKILLKTVALMNLFKISHLDIKPSNILVREEVDKIEFKLADFGLSRHHFRGEKFCEHEFFTISYRPPEFLAERNRSEFDPMKGDIWAIGITIIEYIIQQTLFRGRIINVRGMLDGIYLMTESDVSVDKFIELNKSGKIAGSIDLKIALGRQYDMVSMTTLEYLKIMLRLNPSDRPDAGWLLEKFYGDIYRVNLIALSLYPPEYKRVYGEIYSKLLSEICRSLKMRTSITLIAIEILTRYFGILYPDGVIPNKEEDFFAVAVAICTADGITCYTSCSSEILEVYNIFALPVLSPEDFIRVEREMLKKLSYQLYNHNITQVIETFIAKDLKPWDQDYKVYTQPVKNWAKY